MYGQNTNNNILWTIFQELWRDDTAVLYIYSLLLYVKETNIGVIREDIHNHYTVGKDNLHQSFTRLVIS